MATPISWRACGADRFSTRDSLKGASSWPFVVRGKGVGVLQWPRSCHSAVQLQLASASRSDTPRRNSHFDWARVDFFYRRLRKRDTMSRSRHRVQRQRGRSADEREALLPPKTDTARAARSVRATLNFALRVHRRSMKLRIFSVRQIVPVDSPLLSTSRREIDVFQPLAKAWTKQTRPGGRRGSEASNDGGEVYGAARLLIVRPMLTRLRSRRGRPSAAFRRHPSISID